LHADPLGDAWICHTYNYRREIMRKFKTGLIALAASAALVIPAGLANASTQSASTSNTASTKCVIGLLGCFDIYTGDILSDNDVDVSTAATFCGVQVSVLNALGVGNWMDCGGGKKVHKKS
jgi:hypothetical protein